MASLTDIRASVQRASRELDAALEREALRFAADVAAQVEDRITQTGRTAEGRPLSPYSEKKVPAYFYLGRGRRASSDAAVRRKIKQREGISYKEFRQINGLPTAYKSLEFTGEMWQGFGVKEVRRLGPGVVEVIIGGKNPRTEALLGYHSAREKTEITKPSRQEVALVTRAILARLQTILNNV